MANIKTARIDTLTDTKLLDEIIALARPLGLSGTQRALDLAGKLIHDQAGPVSLEDLPAWQELSKDDQEFIGPLLMPAYRLATALNGLSKERKKTILQKAKNNLWRQNHGR